MSHVFSQERSIYGSFLFNQEVLNYKYTSHPNNLYTLKFFKWENSKNQIKSSISIDDLSTITSIIELKDSIYIQKSIDILEGFNNSELELKITEINPIIASYDNISDILLPIISNTEIIYNKLAEINFESIFSDPTDSVKLKEAREKFINFKNVYEKFNNLISESKSNEKEISLYDIQIKTYKPIIELAIKDLASLNSPLEEQTNNDLDELSTRLFYELKTRIDFFDYQPLAGNIILTNNTVFLKETEFKGGNLFKKGTENILEIKSLEIEQVNLEFASGGIKNIFVYARLLEEKGGLERVKFRNIMPFSISGKFDPEHFNDIALFVDRSTVAEKYSNSNILLSDFLRYDISLSNNNEDYSPSDTTINLSQTIPIAQVLKSKTSKILSARTFTDLIGIDGDQPNGLIQIEVYKKVNLWTDYWQRLICCKSNFLYTGWLSYIEPNFSITKIEENNRFLPLNKPMDDIPFNTDPLQINRYQQFSFGIDLNVFNVNIQNYKSKFFFDLHYDIARTTGQDEANQDEQFLIRMNVSNFGPRLYYQIFPDPRFGFKVGYNATKQVIHSDEVIFGDPEKNWLGTAWFLANLNTNKNGSEMFFRLRFNHILKDIDSNFFEVQIGYAFDILGKN